MALAHCVFGIDNVFDFKLCAAPSDRSGGAPPLFGRPEFKFYYDLFYPAHAALWADRLEPEKKKKGFSKGGFALLKILTNYLHYLHQEHSF